MKESTIKSFAESKNSSTSVMVPSARVWPAFTRGMLAVDWKLLITTTKSIRTSLTIHAEKPRTSQNLTIRKQTSTNSWIWCYTCNWYRCYHASCRGSQLRSRPASWLIFWLSWEARPFQFRTILCGVSRAGTVNSANIYRLAPRGKWVFPGIAR